MPANIPLDLIEEVDQDSESCNVGNTEMTDEVVREVNKKFAPKSNAEILDEF